jgi:hypothetical protein
VLKLLNLENAYNKLSLLPKTNPKWLQLVDPFVYFIQTGKVENMRGSNLNKCYPEQLLNLLFESTYAMGEMPELIVNDHILLSL